MMMMKMRMTVMNDDDTYRKDRKKDDDVDHDAQGPNPSDQYQQEIAVLQEKLRASVQKLEEYEACLKGQDEQAQKVLMEYQARLEESEERLRRQQDDKDLQMKGIISRCVCLCVWGEGGVKIILREPEAPSRIVKQGTFLYPHKCYF